MKPPHGFVLCPRCKGAKRTLPFPGAEITIRCFKCDGKGYCIDISEMHCTCRDSPDDCPLHSLLGRDK